MSRLTPPRPWSPLSDDAWLALAPYVLPRAPQGRRIADLRARMDAIFQLAHTPNHPWAALPPQHGNPQSLARFFRRLTHAGLWHRLLEALAEAHPGHPLRTIEYAICRATKRAARLGGMPLLLLIRRLGLRTALDAPPWLLPNPLLSELCARSLPRSLPTTRPAIAALKRRLKILAALAKTAAGRRRIPRSVRNAWPGPRQCAALSGARRAAPSPPWMEGATPGAMQRIVAKARQSIVATGQCAALSRSSPGQRHPRPSTRPPRAG